MSEFVSLRKIHEMRLRAWETVQYYGNAGNTQHPDFVYWYDALKDLEAAKRQIESQLNEAYSLLSQAPVHEYAYRSRIESLISELEG